mgnify:CR=1 FL=1
MEDHVIICRCEELGRAPEGDECSSMRPPVRPISIENMMSEKE